MSMFRNATIFCQKIQSWQNILYPWKRYCYTVDPRDSQTSHFWIIQLAVYRQSVHSMVLVIQFHAYGRIWQRKFCQDCTTLTLTIFMGLGPYKFKPYLIKKGLNLCQFMSVFFFFCFFFNAMYNIYMGTRGHLIGWPSLRLATEISCGLQFLCIQFIFQCHSSTHPMLVAAITSRSQMSNGSSNRMIISGVAKPGTMCGAISMYVASWSE